MGTEIGQEASKEEHQMHTNILAKVVVSGLWLDQGCRQWTLVGPRLSSVDFGWAKVVVIGLWLDQGCHLWTLLEMFMCICVSFPFHRESYSVSISFLLSAWHPLPLITNRGNYFSVLILKT